MSPKNPTEFEKTLHDRYWRYGPVGRFMFRLGARSLGPFPHDWWKVGKS